MEFVLGPLFWAVDKLIVFSWPLYYIIPTCWLKAFYLTLSNGNIEQAQGQLCPGAQRHGTCIGDWCLGMGSIGGGKWKDCFLLDSSFGVRAVFARWIYFVATRDIACFNNTSWFGRWEQAGRVWLVTIRISVNKYHQKKSEVLVVWGEHPAG